MTLHKPQSQFDICNSLVRACERVYVGGKKGPFDDHLLNRVMFGPFLVVAGARGAAMAFAIWLGVSIVLLLLVFWIAAILHIGSGPGRRDAFMIGFYLLTSCYVLAPPSRLAFADISSRMIENVCVLSPGIESLTAQAKQGVLSILAFAERSASRRMTLLWFFPAFMWTIALFLARIGYLDKDGNALGHAAMASLSALLIALVVAAYGRAIAAVFALASSALALQDAPPNTARAIRSSAHDVRKSTASRRKSR